MNYNEEYSKSDERFYHEDEFNRDFEYGLSKKESYEGSQDEEVVEEKTVGKHAKGLKQRISQTLRVGAITATVISSGVIVSTMHEHRPTNDWVTIHPSTCVSYGDEGMYCADCGKMIDFHLLDYSGHEMGEWVVSIESNCSHPGTEDLLCLICGEILEQRETELGDHVHGEWEVMEQKTCTHEGYEIKKCLVCDAEVDRQSIPASHVIIIDAAVAANCYHTGLSEGSHCSQCNEVIEKQMVLPITHSVVAIKGYAPSCRETGLSDGEQCSICNKVLVQQKVLPAAHTPQKIAGYPANCETFETGLTDGSICSICGYVISAQQEIQPQHNEEVYIPNGWQTTATCTEGVVGMGRCKVCGMETSTYIEIANALGHNYVDRVVTDDTGMTNVWRECSRCGAIE